MGIEQGEEGVYNLRMERGNCGFNKKGVFPYDVTESWSNGPLKDLTPNQQENIDKFSQAIFEPESSPESRPMQEDKLPSPTVLEQIKNKVINGDNLIDIVLFCSALASVGLVLSGDDIQKSTGLFGVVSSGTMSHVRTTFRL